MASDAYLAKVAAERGDRSAKQTGMFLAHWTTFSTGKDVTSALLDDFRTHLAVKYAPASRNRVIGATKAFLRWLKRRGELVVDLDALAYYKPTKAQPVVLTPDQIKALCAAAMAEPNGRGKRWRRYLVMGLVLGARPGELSKITAEHVNLAAREVTIHAGKTGQTRRVPFHDSPACIALLETLVKARKGVLVNVGPKSFRLLAAKAGLNMPRKVLRSTSAAYIASSGRYNEYMLGQRFGHSAEVAAEHYRQPIWNIAGDTVEQWMGCEAELMALVQA